jgi:hypothetical protein
VVTPLRTPVGSFGGSLRALTTDQLAVHVIRAVLARSNFPADEIDEVIVAQSCASSEVPCLGRYAAVGGGSSAGRAGIHARLALQIRPAGHHRHRNDGANRGRRTWFWSPASRT